MINLNLKFTVKENNKYTTLKQILKHEFNISNRLLIKLKNSKQILLNGVYSHINSKIHLNDIVDVNISFEEISENIVPIEMNLDILYEDEYLLIVNKSSNTAIHPSHSHFDDSLSNGVQYYFNSINLKRKIRPVNRLDKDTSRNCCVCKK